MKKDKKKKERRSRSKSPYDRHNGSYPAPNQAWGDVRTSMPAYPMAGNTFVPWTGEPVPMQQTIPQPVTAGTVFYPSINARPYSPEPDMGYATRNMIRVNRTGIL